MVIYLFVVPTPLFMKAGYKTFDRKGMHPQRRFWKEVNGVMCSPRRRDGTQSSTNRSTVLRAPKKPPEAYGLYSCETQTIIPTAVRAYEESGARS
jgi:hypothetical protein